MAKCKKCGKSTSNTDGLCGECQFKHGEIWTFDMALPPDEWHWRLEIKGEKQHDKL